MNANSLYIGLAIVALILLPFIIGAITRHRKSKTITQEFLQIGLKYGIEISETEIWNDRIMGISSEGKKILFRHTNTQNTTETLIDLSQVTNCSYEIDYIKSTTVDKAIESIVLIFSMKGGKESTYLSIYNCDLDLSVYSEVQIVEKWAAKIKALLS